MLTFSKKIRLSKAVCICLASACFATSINAQESEEAEFKHSVVDSASAYDELKGFVPKKTVTGSKMDIPVIELPQSMSTVTKEMMSVRGAIDMASITSYDASIGQIYSGDQRTNYGRLRGFSSLYAFSFLDGLKLLYLDHAIPKLDPYMLEKVEVLKGPSSVLYGSSSAGGLLNSQSKRPKSKNGGEVGFGVESHSTVSVYGDVNRVINDDVQMRVVSKLRKGNNELDQSTHRSYFIAPSLTYLIGEDTTLEILSSLTRNEIKGIGYAFGGNKAKVTYHNSAAQNAAGIKSYLNAANPAFTAIPDATYIANLQSSANSVNAANIPATKYIGLPNDEKFDKQSKMIGANVTHVISPSTTFRSNARFADLEAEIFFSQASASGLSGILATASPDVSKVPLEYIESRAEAKTLAFDESLEHRWAYKNIQNTTVGGVDFQYTRGKSSATKPVSYTFDLINTDYSQTITKTNELNTYTKSTTMQTGVYAQNQARYKNMTFLTSMRQDWLVENSRNMLKGAKTEYDYAKFSGRVGMTYAFESGFVPYTTYSTSFEPNSGSDKNSNKFVPSVGRQVELGVKFKPKGFEGLFTLAAFNIEKSNILRTDTSNTAYQVQEGNAKVQGLEFEAVTSPVENLNVTLSVARMSTEENGLSDSSKNGRQLEETPEFIATLWSDYQVKNTKVGHLRFGGGVKHIGKRVQYNKDYLDLDDGQPEKAYYSGAYRIVDMMVGTTYKGVDYSLNVNNVLNKEIATYANSIGTNETAGTSFAFNVKYRF